jgi:hypothetical protein
MDDALVAHIDCVSPRLHVLAGWCRYVAPRRDSFVKVWNVYHLGSARIVTQVQPIKEFLKCTIPRHLLQSCEFISLCLVTIVLG